MKYKTKLVEIEAHHYDGDRVAAIRWSEEMSSPLETWLYMTEDRELMISTLEGNMHVSLGDYIICGLKGEFYPCKPDIFYRKYELVGTL